VSGLALRLDEPRDRMGLKGPRAAEWLAARGFVLPTLPNTWTHSQGAHAAARLLVTRLGSTEFFIEDAAAGTTLKRMAAAGDELPPGVYPVLREDWALDLCGSGVHDVLAQVCNVNFAALILDSHPVIMTLMIGVAVLVVADGGTGELRYRIWCDPTFGPYLSESLGAVVGECGGRIMGVAG
jgi:sarcosine oxidase, subunit gamma